MSSLIWLFIAVVGAAVLGWALAYPLGRQSGYRDGFHDGYANGNVDKMEARRR